MTDERPRPQYGEYATPEEQRARIRQPDASWAIESGHAPDATPPAAPVAVAVAPASTAPKTGTRVVDRVITIVLLALGFVHVAITATMLFLFDRAIVFLLDSYGLDSARLTDTTDLRLAGTFAAIAMIALWLLAAGSSWWAMRRGRRAFWIPIVAALVAMVVVSSFLDPALSAQPVVRDLLEGFSAGTLTPQ